MSDCPKCGRENTQAEGSYCTFCGAGLKDWALPQGPSKIKTSEEVDDTPLSLQRLEKITKRVERLGYIVTAELAVLLVVIVVLMFTFNLI